MKKSFRLPRVCQQLGCLTHLGIGAVLGVSPGRLLPLLLLGHSVLGVSGDSDIGGGAGEEVPSFAAGSSAAGLSNSPLASVSSWVLTPDGFFLFFFSSDILSLDFREDSEFGFPSSASTEAEEECVARACM